MKRMLINATQEEELRMAMVDGQRLYDLNIEAPASERKKANIYKGKITRVEPSLEAAFVDYGAERHGFLPMKEISSEYFVKENKSGGKPNIRDVLKEGQDIVVQVDKEERGNKGAALTTFVSLAGRFIVLKPNKDRSGGVSRRITGADRDDARQSLNDVIVPDGMSVILRTAGIDRSAEELAWDLENLLTVWTAILNVVLERPSPFLLYRESDSVVRALRDYLTNEIGEILIDDEATYKDALEHVQQTMPHNIKKLKHYVDPVPLFTRFQIESQIESAFAHNVTLPSGGSIVIDHTEAMVSIDINSARATKGGDIEATALNTNLEAAEEVARQLRIRDLGGLIVIDFIDMGPQKHQRDVENRLRDAVRQDRARVQIGKISRFGLLEMSRQRLRPSIGESAYKTCPRCTGFGTIRGTESLALAILRIIGEEARKERTAKVIAQLPVEVATYLLNEKRDWVQNLESRNDTQVVLVANSALETPHYDVRRVRDDQTELAENAGVSYSLAEAAPEPESPQAILERKGAEPAAVGTLKPSTPAPKRQEPKGKGLIATILGWFGVGEDDDEKKRSQQRRGKNTRNTRGGRSQQSRKRGDNRKNAQGGDKRGQQRKKTKKKAPQKQQNRKQAQQDSSQKQKPKQDQKQQQAQQSDEAKGETKRTRSRRSRGGRRRRRSNADKPEQATDQQQNNQGAQNQQPKADASKQEQQPKQDAQKQEQPKRERKPRQEKPKLDKPIQEQKAPESGAGDAKPKSEQKSAEAKPVDVKPKPEQKPADAKPVDAKPKPEQKPADAKPVDSKPKAEKKPAEAKPARVAKPKSDGPPKVRTDAERAADSPKTDATGSYKIPPAPKADKKAPDAKPAAEAKVEVAKPVAKPASKLLPWEDGGNQQPKQD
ncbi:MAG: Rne/Rng family ribonuclease [Gammaproteobacteria bacterium]|nr:Rne/Rng family ribonuclease [Gammaproteobacteria bacterium]